MALEISLYPTLYNCFHRLKYGHDPEVYDAKETAIPRFDKIYIQGTGANVSEVITITRNGTMVVQAIASSGGTFSVEAPLVYDQSNTFQASGTSSGDSNLLVFDVYHWLLIHYLLSLQFKDVQTGMGQAKQDLYCDSKVGDAYTTTGDVKYFETETDEYQTSHKALMDKMTLPVPSDYWERDFQDAVKKAISISEKGPVHASLQALKFLYENVGLQKIFTFQWEYPIFWDLDATKIPHMKGLGDMDTLVIPANKKVRFGHSYDWVTVGEKEIVFTAVPSGTYYWIYVDGGKDIDDTLEVKTSTVQPVPGLYETTLTFSENAVETDDEEGTVTGIPYQAYVTLSPPLASVSTSLEISDGTGNITNAEVISREIVALGRANTSGTLSITYEYWMESVILCVLKFGSSHVEEFLRIWALPNHIRPQFDIETESLQIYFKMSSGMSESVRTSVLNSISNVLKLIIPITIGFEPYVNMGFDDQAYVAEDGLNWSAIWKGYTWLPVYVPPSQREIYEDL